MTTSRLAQLGFLSVLAATTLAHAGDPVRLNKDEAHATISGKSLSYEAGNGIAVQAFYAANGNVTLRTFKGAVPSTGTWTIEDDGRICHKILKGNTADFCRSIFKTDTGYALSTSQTSSGLIPINKID